MDLETEILERHSKQQVLRIVSWIGSDKRRFRQLMNLFLHGEYRVTQWAAWVISNCADKHPRLIIPWLTPLFKRMEEPGVHVAVKRNVLHILEWVEIPKSLLGAVVSRCFEYLGSESEAIAVRVYSMAIILRVSKNEPELRNELRASIEQMLPNAGPAIRALARFVFKQLQKGMNHGRGKKRTRSIAVRDGSTLDDVQDSHS